MIEFLANFLIAIVIAVLCLVFIEFVGFIVEVPKQLKRIADALEKDKKDRSDFDAIKFLKERERMCQEGCEKCGLSIDNNGRETLCNDFCSFFPEEAIEVVKKWSKENEK